MQLIRTLIVGLELALVGMAASARDADAIRHAGVLTVCANRDALPVSSDTALPGFQLEIAREIASELGVRLHVEWIWASYQARYTDCDMTLGMARNPKPGGYARYLPALTDVEIVLAFRGSERPVALADLKGMRVAVPSTTLAHFKLIDLGAETRVAHQSDDAILDALRRRDVAAGVVSSMNLAWYRTQHPDFETFHMSTKLLGVESAYPMTIGLRQMDALAQADFEDIVFNMRADGRLQSILAKYGQTLSTEFDNPYARLPDAVSPPASVQVRKDIIEQLQQHVRGN
jgi:ABC-type amino acid transport substrate-binding protein